MFTFLVPLVSLLISLPGIPGLGSKLPKLKIPHKAATDTIPPTWKPLSLLSVEDAYVFANLPPLGPEIGVLKVVNDARRMNVSVDPDSGTVSVMPELGEVQLATGKRMTLAEYDRELTQSTFERMWIQRSRESISAGNTVTTVPRGPGLQFNLPVALPKLAQSVLGPGGPAISVTGSENIKLSGTSEWSNQQTGLLGQRRSLFPALDMQQDLDIHLEGQLSDRVKVNLLQNSATQIPLANKIAINYRGDEDDLVQSLDLGNTNLSLPGTQYVSYSGYNEGLFGMKTTTRVGPLDFTMLASKQEGKSERASYAGGSARQTPTLNDYDYIKGQYFFLYDPNFETQAIDLASIRLYLDDGNNYSNQVNTVRGRAFVDPRAALIDSVGPDTVTQFTPSVRGRFRQLTLGAENDYEVLNNFYGPLYYVIRLKTPISGEQQRLAVTYNYRAVDAAGQPTGTPIAMGGDEPLDTDGTKSTTMKLLRAPLFLLPARPDGTTTPPYETDPRASPFAPTRELELRNVYQLGYSKIDAKTFSLKVRRGVDQPPVYFETQGNVSIPYFELLGLDTFDEKSGTPIYRKQDGQVDGTLPQSTSRVFVDYENGTLFFFDLRPFAPRILDGDPTYPSRPFEKFLSTILSRRDSLVGTGEAPNARNTAIYDIRNPDRSLVSRYYIDLDFAAQSAGREINLGRSNIIENSEAVTINGRRLERNRDYQVDYDLGKITLTAQPSATDQINVDYGYAPLFQQAGRTLIGSAFKLDGVDKNLGGAFMYESKGAQDLRPRLGEEPSRVLIGDLNGTWSTKPAFLTRWIDALPGVRTTAQSAFNVSAEMGASFPNPNTFNEVFVDDMEGVRDAVSLTMTSDRWRWSSQPSRMNGFVRDSIQSATMKDAEVHWFTPINAVKERDLKPNLTDAQGAQNPHQALAISIPRRPLNAGPNDSLWVGLTYPLDPVGIDLSRSQYIELWVNDFNDQNKVPRTAPGRVRLHIDVGAVSEDQRRSPGVAANRVLDSEDLPPRDNQLIVTDSRNEDSGLDGQLNGIEAADPSLTTSTVDDPGGDDFPRNGLSIDQKDGRKNLQPALWLLANGTEGNKNVFPFPDTEDLNLNNSLDLDENYFEYTVDLGSSPYLVDSVYVPGATYASNKDPIPIDNGWRRYRIPMTDTLRVAFGSPDLRLARQVRVWLEGVTVTDDVQPTTTAAGELRPIVMLGGLDIVGSRWRATDLPPAQVAIGTTMTLNSVNNVDNADIYAPPFDPGSTRNGAQDLIRREQSLALEWTNLQPADTLEAFKTFSLDEDYSRYGTLRWYVAGFGIPGYIPATGNLFYFVRFSSDELGRNYYEFRSPVPPSSTPGNIGWQQVALQLTELSNLKLTQPVPDTVDVARPGGAPGERLIVHGRPSFTRLRRISFGVVNLDGVRVYDAGQVWLDEIRATDVARDRGQAQRLTVGGRMANLFDYGFNYNSQDEDFLSVGQTRGSGSRTNNYSATANIDLHRFFEGTGILLPVSLNLQSSRAQPRYTAGDDVFRTGALAEASENRSTTRSYSVRYQRTWSERSNPFLRYTLGGITANLSQARSESRTPASVDTARSLAAGVNYNISPRGLMPIPLPGSKKIKFYPLPERFYWNYAIQTSSARGYDRLRDARGSLVLRSATVGRIAGIDFGADSRPFELIHHQFQGKRNLTLPEQLREQIGFINLGKVVQWSQNMDATANVKGGQWFRPQFGWNASYTQNNGPELSPDLSIRAIGNAQSYRMAWTLPFDQVAIPKAPAKRDTSRKTPPGPRKPTPMASLLSKLGAVTVDASFNQGSSFSRLSGTPHLAYMVGLANDPGFGGPVAERFGNTEILSEEWRSGVRSKVGLFLGASVQTHGEFSARRNTYNNVVSRSRRSAFPDLDVDFGKIPDAIGLKKLFSNPRLRTAFSQSQNTEFANSRTPTSISKSSEWRPLLGFTGDLKNGTRAEFRVQHRATESQYTQAGRWTTTDANTDIDLSLTRSYTKGQKVNLLGKESTVKTSVNLGMTGTYSRHDSKTLQEGVDLPINPVSEDRLSVNGRGSYGFSGNVTGNVELGFSQTRDLQKDIVTRSIRVELRAQFGF